MTAQRHTQRWHDTPFFFDVIFHHFVPLNEGHCRRRNTKSEMLSDTGCKNDLLMKTAAQAAVACINGPDITTLLCKKAQQTANESGLKTTVVGWTWIWMPTTASTAATYGESQYRIGIVQRFQQRLQAKDWKPVSWAKTILLMKTVAPGATVCIICFKWIGIGSQFCALNTIFLGYYCSWSSDDIVMMERTKKNPKRKQQTADEIAQKKVQN